jgi:membrane peptidoglycan carboxypeptidase
MNVTGKERNWMRQATQAEAAWLRSLGSRTIGPDVPIAASRGYFFAGAKIASALFVIGGAIAVGIATRGYFLHDDQAYLDRIASYTQNPIFGANGTLIGSIGLASDTVSGDEAANKAFIPLQAKRPPKVFEDALIHAENRQFHAEGIRNVCGLDLPGTAWTVISSLGFGGSTLSMMLAKQLLGGGDEATLVSKGWRYLTNLGASCRMYRAVEKNGGKDAVRKLIAAYLPIGQGAGVLRGVEGASHTFFDAKPDDLSLGQQLLFAAAVKRPLPLLKAGDLGVPCNQVWPKQTFSYKAGLAAKHPARQGQCRITFRAKDLAKAVLSKQDSKVAIAELDQMEKIGIAPVNPFNRIPSKRLINLSTRTASALQAGLVNLIRNEAEENDFAIGTPLVLSLDAVAQHNFSMIVKQRLLQIQSSDEGRATLCMPLAKPADAKVPSGLQRCAGNSGALVADVLAVKVIASSGAIKAIYSSTPNLLNATLSLASLNKWIVMFAALRANYDETSLLCPKSAKDAARVLHRVTLPVEGYANCDGGVNAISLRAAIAKSDNLAIYELAKMLGNRRLKAAATLLGIGKPEKSKNIAYELAFGTYGGSPAELIAASQALFAAAYSIRTTGEAPRILSNVEPNIGEAVSSVASALRTSAQRASLKTLLEAPVNEDGTLAFTRGKIVAGKTGSSQSVTKNSEGRLYAMGKFIVAYQPEDNAINFFLVTSPSVSVPLATHSVRNSLFASAQFALMNSTNTATNNARK